MLMGEYAFGGKLCTRFMEKEACFLVDKSPLLVLDESIHYYGFNLMGAMKSSRLALGKKSMVPIMINPAQKVCVFPTKSPFKHDCIWFNPEHIVNTTSDGNKTIVHFKNRYNIAVDMRLFTFNNKLQIARQQCDLFSGRALNTITSLSTKPIMNRQIIKEKSGKYNFDILIKDKDE